jgi:hypothetical protein
LKLEKYVIVNVSGLLEDKFERFVEACITYIPYLPHEGFG